MRIILFKEGCSPSEVECMARAMDEYAVRMHDRPKSEFSDLIVRKNNLICFSWNHNFSDHIAKIALSHARLELLNDSGKKFFLSKGFRVSETSNIEKKYELTVRMLRHLEIHDLGGEWI